MGRMWWKHVRGWWICYIGDPGSAGSGWDKCVSQAHCICLILGGSAGRVSQPPPISVHCTASSFSKQPLTKCWNSRLYLWACVLSELEQGLCLMCLLCYCIMFYRAPHVDCAVFVFELDRYGRLTNCSEFCSKNHIVTIWGRERNKYGSPVGLFTSTWKSSSRLEFCYYNAPILLTGVFLRAGKMSPKIRKPWVMQTS